MLLKLITILSIACTAVVAQGTTTNDIDGFLFNVREQNARNVQNHDRKLNALKQTFNAQIATVATSSQLLFDTLAQNEKHLNLLQLINKDGKRCVDQYIKILPTQFETRQNASRCTRDSETQLEKYILQGPKLYRDDLDIYYRNNFEQDINKCVTNNKNNKNAADCILSVIEKSESYTTTNQQRFNEKLDAAYCSARNFVKISLDCSFVVAYNTNSAISDVDQNINQCIWGQDSCEGSSKTSLCSEVKYITRSQALTTDKTLENPYYGTARASDCLTLMIV